MKRNLIKTLIILVLAIAGTSVANAQFRYGAIAGVQSTNLKFKQDLIGVSGEIGFQAGVQGELMFPGLGFGLDLGLIYNQLGAKVNLSERKIWSSLGYGNPRVYIHDILIPMHLRFKWTRMNGLEDIIAPFVYGGPDFNITVGHSKCDAFKYAGGDLGLTVGGGFELFRNWQISCQYTWGMTYAVKTALLDNFSARNRSLSIRATYFFK